MIGSPHKSKNIHSAYHLRNCWYLSFTSALCVCGSTSSFKHTHLVNVSSATAAELSVLSRDSAFRPSSSGFCCRETDVISDHDTAALPSHWHRSSLKAQPFRMIQDTPAVHVNISIHIVERLSPSLAFLKALDFITSLAMPAALLYHTQAKQDFKENKECWYIPSMHQERGFTFTTSSRWKWWIF